MNISELIQTLKFEPEALSMGQKLLAGCATALLAMCVVFVILVLISLIIKIINSTPQSSNKEMAISKKEEAVDQVSKGASLEDNSQLVAVITAAISASTGKNIVVRRISRTNNVQSSWEKVQV